MKKIMFNDKYCLTSAVLNRTKTMTRRLLKHGKPCEAFECLIDKISGKGTWGSNPFAVAYSFELID